MNRHLPTLPERVFLCVGSILTITLLAKAVMLASAAVTDVAVAVMIWLAGYWFAVRRTEPNGVARMIINFVTVWLLYSGSGRIINAIQLPDCGELLLSWDRQLFGESPAVSLQSLASPWMNEILSAGYLTYHVYLLWFLLHTIWLPPNERVCFTRPLWTAFGLGFSVYFLMPAAGICVSFPELFPRPIEGYWITSFVDALVANMAASYDSFPSMHVFVTSVMLFCDFMHQRRRFWIMLIPSLVMLVSTVLLRMHFTVDLIVSAILLIPFVWFFVDRKPQ
ncbi:MAG: phosphatase PAP2 family protein [Planctomycetaceae bacterium]